MLKKNVAQAPYTARCGLRGTADFTKSFTLHFQVTLFTRGKAELAPKIADEVTYHWQVYKESIKHIQGDRKDYKDLKRKIGPQKFDGRPLARLADIVS